MKVLPDYLELKVQFQPSKHTGMMTFFSDDWLNVIFGKDKERKEKKLNRDWYDL